MEGRSGGKEMKLISWNVNGLRACLGKGFLDYFQEADADFFCLQETKLQAGQVDLNLPGYHQYWNYAEKKGYSGTAIFAKEEPENVIYGVGVPELDTEGRLITLEYPNYYVVTCYTPNAQEGLKRIDHRMAWEDALRGYLKGLDEKKPVLFCGDLNVARTDIDLKNPGPNRGNAGFSDQEKEKIQLLLDSGFTDSFRHLYPEATGKYSWWSYRFSARKNNAGWRIDYWLTSDRIADKIQDAGIEAQVYGSDHCPVTLILQEDL
jgi:exodeoxyribonuclease-3